MDSLKLRSLFSWVFGQEKETKAASATGKDAKEQSPSKAPQKPEREPIPDSFSAHIIHALDLMDNMDRYL